MPTVRTVSEQQPIHGRATTADGDREARRRLCSAHGPALAAAVLRIVGDPRRVEPIVAAVLDEASATDAGLPTDRASVDAWLFALARRHLAANEPAPRSDLHRAAVAQPASPRRAGGSFRRPLDVVPRRPGPTRRAPEPRYTPRAALWIAGAALALAGLALALALVPPTVEPPRARHLPTGELGPLIAPEPGTSRMTAVAVAETVAPPTPGPRLFVHHMGGLAADRARLVADYLAQAGFAVADLRAVPVTIETRTVRFFHAEDRSAALAVADALDRLEEGLPGRGQRRVVDLTHYRPLPERGTVEVWLPPSPPRDG
jgi:hypothetical protein